MESVRVWQEEVIIPTYGIGKPEKNPIFLEKRVYQGSSGVVYPHPVIEKIEDEKKDKAYQAIYLENEYLKIMILPELGGRIQMAFDKVKNRHFIYYNQVIKPALVGLTGPWISGGIEFNWPQHHRPSTFDPIDFKISENEDGSKTVWVSEIERMFQTKGMAGFTLHPDKAYLEIEGVLYNRTNIPQTFLWWANPAVKVNDHYQSVFPPDVYAVFDHGKRDVSSFPIAKGTYYKVDYSPGTDISWYKNIPVPTSYMAIKSKYDFMGGWENDSKGGLLHVANHHLSPGKKQWTWGNGEFGFAWDRHLTDEDGPYIELMTGVFTDNQPDFSWIMPNEERRFKQYFMPYGEIGIVKNATKEAALNFELNGKNLEFKAYSTSFYANALIKIIQKGRIIFSEIIDVSPENTYSNSIPFDEKFEDCLLSLETENGVLLVSYQPEEKVENEIPEPAIAAKHPSEYSSNEQLFLTGHHIEQYRHATFLATDYYLEALRRDPKDSRCNNAMGLWNFKKGQFQAAKSYFEEAIKTLTQRNPNPYDGEAYYNLGLCQTFLGNYNEAFDAFYKATWNTGFQDATYLELARIATRKKDFNEALNLAQKSLIKNWNGHVARHLNSTLFRKLNRENEALAVIEESIAIDGFNIGCYFEKYLITKNADLLHEIKVLLRNNPHTYLEFAIDYLKAGLFEEAIAFLSIIENESSPVYPLVSYFLAFAYYQNGDSKASYTHLSAVEKSSPEFVFPNRLYEILVLNWAIEQNPNDANALYFAGNFWYANRQYHEAINSWESSARLKPNFPTVFRNLSLAYFNKQNNPEKSLSAMEQAFSLDPTDARVLMELDQLYKNLNHKPAKRLELLEKYHDLVLQRDDLYLEKITLNNILENYKEAYNLLKNRLFHPWEGGEGKVVGQFLICCIELAKIALAEGKFEECLEILNQTESYPHNLGEGKLFGTQENDINYFKGVAYAQLGEKELAEKYFSLASEGLPEPVQAIFYNDQQPDKILYQGLALNNLERSDEAEMIFKKLITFGKNHLNDDIKIDYFAVSLPDLMVFDGDLNIRNHIHCHYLIGLGYLGLNESEKANFHFELALKANINHQGAAIHKKMIEFLELA
jgi:tetratricopeptide (TPR) repeat protein